MKEKINARFMTVSAIAIILTGVCTMLLFYSILKNQIFDDLKANAHVVSMIDLDDISQQMDDRLSADGLRITLIAADGTVLYDSAEDVSKMGNHGDRAEFMQAMSEGEGKAVRKSATSSRHTFYYAMRTEEGTVLRIGKESSSIYKLLFNMSRIIPTVGLIVFILCAVLSHSLTRRLLEPIEKMANNIMMIEEDEVYDELKPFAATIKQQHVDILKHAQIRQEFTANVSHELKTPLTAISGYAELIENGMTNGDDTIHFAGEIHHSAERLQRLINDIIKLSELDGSDLKMEFEEIDLYELAENTITNMQFTAEKNDIKLSVDGEHICIRGNKTLMEELLYNLCSNAVRYNKKGGSVTVTVAMQEEHPVLLVKDTGIGIPKEQQERVFERFYRVDKSRSKSTGGTGLGLAIVKHIVAQHEAQITLASEEGVGTEVKVVF